MAVTRQDIADKLREQVKFNFDSSLDLVREQRSKVIYAMRLMGT